MKARISKAGKFSKMFPRNVANEIRKIAEEYPNVRSVNITDVDQDYTFYVGEGYNYTGLASNGKKARFQVVSENTIGAMNVSHRIGERFSMPEGTYLVQVSYYSGYHMTVYRIGLKELTAG